MQALGLTRAGKPLGNQDLSRRQSREDRSVAGYRRDLKQGSGNIHESTRAARKFPEDARTARRSYRGRIYNTGVRIAKAAFKAIESRIQRDNDLHKYEVLITPQNN